MRSRIAEIDENTVAHVFRDKAVERVDSVGDHATIGGDDLTQIFGIEPRGELCRSDQVAEHYRQLPPLGGVGYDRRNLGQRLRRRRPELGDSLEHDFAMTE